MKSFTYMGHVFTPAMRLRSRKNMFEYVTAHITHDGVFLSRHLGCWDYDDFYAAARAVGGDKYDLFSVDTHDGLFIPARNCLFKWFE